MGGRAGGDVNPDVQTFRFDLEPSAPMRAEIAALEADGYRIYREWANGLELRKESKIGSCGTFVRCALAFMAPVIFVPLFGRSILALISGYEYRVILTRDATEPRVILV